MCIKLIRVPEAIAILIAEYPLSLKEIISAVEYKRIHRHNPEGISVILYSPDERDIAHAEYEVLANDAPNYHYTHEIPSTQVVKGHS